MARANLNVSAEVREEFLAAQEGGANIRLIKVGIQDESLVMLQKAEKISSAQADFDSVLNSAANENEASLILFRCDNEGANWLLVSWIPDGCRVRDKMLFSSSREDLKRTLGLGYFMGGDYAANNRADLTWEGYRASVAKDAKGAPLTERETLLKEERDLMREEVQVNSSKAMGVMPFAVSAQTIASWSEFASKSVSWVEMKVENEEVQLVSSKLLAQGESLQALVSEEDARFIMMRLSSSSSSSSAAASSTPSSLTFFVFSCPENVPVRQKMTMSSSKASVLAAAMANGLVAFDRNVEIRAAADIEELVKELDPTQSVFAAASSAAATSLHAKPMRAGARGRGTAQIKKFVADDDA